MAITIVLFDLGNVLAAWDTRPRLEEYARRSGLSQSEVIERLSTDEFWINTDRGLFSAEEMEARICQLLDCNFSRAELLRLQAMAFDIRPDVLSLVRETAIRTRVGILTNNAPLLRDAMPHHLPELVALFDPILFSFQFAHVKPERELFEAVEDQLDISGAEILFIDDNRGHVAAAAAAGWDAVLYQSPIELRRSLVEREIIDDIG